MSATAAAAAAYLGAQIWPGQLGRVRALIIFANHSSSSRPDTSEGVIGRGRTITSSPRPLESSPIRGARSPLASRRPPSSFRRTARTPLEPLAKLEVLRPVRRAPRATPPPRHLVAAQAKQVQTRARLRVQNENLAP